MDGRRGARIKLWELFFLSGLITAHTSNTLWRMQSPANSSLRGRVGCLWIALLLFSGVGLLTIAPPLLGADGSETWVQSIREANLESLVFITVKAQRANGLIDTFTGTGFLVHPAGYVLTCNHLIPQKTADYIKIDQIGSVGGHYGYFYLPINRCVSASS
jgi:hypothetical protein